MGLTIKRRDVEQLRSEAAEAGDEAMVAICELALSGDRQQFERGDSRFGDDESHAWRKCLNAIEWTAAQR
jgi:hypothetical protein